MVSSLKQAFKESHSKCRALQFHIFSFLLRLTLVVPDCWTFGSSGLGTVGVGFVLTSEGSKCIHGFRVRHLKWELAEPCGSVVLLVFFK